MKRDVHFKSGAETCAGWFFTPPGEGPFPAVAMAHGLGAVKEMYLAPFAETFAAAGIAALLFDYRGYGDSGGMPRHEVSPRNQMDDYRNALTWLSLQPEVDESRLGVWGTSFSGGHVLQIAASDRRVKAVVSQVGAMDLWRNAVRVTQPDVLAATRAFATAESKRLYADDGATPMMIALAAPPGGAPALQVDAETTEWLTTAQATVAPAWRNEVTLSSVENILEHAPALVIDRIGPTPLLMILATDDAWTPPDLIREAFARAGDPKKLVEIPGGHYAVYHGDGQTRAATEATAWFQAHLAVS